jgi:trimethylamine--corrinoid protein Co-methyltransferase
MMIKRVREGFGFSRESASLQEIKDTGPAGMFAANPATLERMHTSTFMPELADRKLREHWELEGSSNIHQRALNKVFDILSTPNAAAFDADVDARIRKEFDGLVAGDAKLQEGWTRFDIGSKIPVRERRPNRRRQKKAS